MTFITGEGFGTDSNLAANLSITIIIAEKSLELLNMDRTGQIPQGVLAEARHVGLPAALLGELPQIVGDGNWMDVDSKALYRGLELLAERIAKKHPIAKNGERGLETDVRQIAR